MMYFSEDSVDWIKSQLMILLSLRFHQSVLCFDIVVWVTANISGLERNLL